MKSALAKARGCLLGGLIGDAMGSPTEGMEPEAIEERFGWVDDFDGTGTDTITVSSYRAPTLYRALAYNITSKALTSDINTSYVNSLAKQFEISA